MRKDQIAAQMYSFRQFWATPAEFLDTLGRVKAMGYDAIQVSPSMPAMPAAELRKQLDDAGLLPVSACKKGASAIDQTDEVIDYLQELGCAHTVYPCPPVLETEEEVVALAHKLEAAAVRMREAGITLGYHNHAIEFNRYGNRTMLDIVYEEAPHMDAEIDTYWVQAGGGDPVAWVRRMDHRMEQIHLKDFTMAGRQSQDAPVGEGNLNWPAIIGAAEAGGVEYFVVEHDGTCPDPFASFQSSINFLLRNYVR
jgi:sugar phosphate isomerase/epimerase